MYKSSGKKYKGARETQAGHGKYRASSGYPSDVYRTDDDDEYDESESFYAASSPDYYFTGGGGGGGHGKSSASSYNTHQPGHGHPKSNLNYYSGPKSHDRYYPNYDTVSSSRNKHKGKEPAYKLNKYQTIVLKVQIHCDACIRKVKKAIAEIDGVESISVDQKQKKVTVTGYIDPKKVVKKVAKTGKSVELVGGGSVKDMESMLNNKAALIMAASDHHTSNNHNRGMLAGVTNMKPYTVQVEKSSRISNNVPQYIHMTPQVRSDMDYMFSDDNANSCSIM